MDNQTVHVDDLPEPITQEANKLTLFSSLSETDNGSIMKIIPNSSAIEQRTINHDYFVTVEGFPVSTSKSEIKQFFSNNCKDIKGIYFLNDEHITAVVEFENEVSVNSALSLNNSKMNGCIVKIFPSISILQPKVESPYHSNTNSILKLPENANVFFEFSSPSPSLALSTLLSSPSLSSISEPPTITEEAVIIHSLSNKEESNYQFSSPSLSSSSLSSSPLSPPSPPLFHSSSSNLRTVSALNLCKTCVMNDNSSLFSSPSDYATTIASPSSTSTPSTPTPSTAQWGSHCSFSSYYVTDVQGNKRIAEYDYTMDKKRRKL